MTPQQMAQLLRSVKTPPAPKSQIDWINTFQSQPIAEAMPGQLAGDLQGSGVSNAPYVNQNPPGYSIFDTTGFVGRPTQWTPEELYKRATLAERYALGQGWDMTREGAKDIIWPGQPGAPENPVFTDPVIYGGPNAGQNPFDDSGQLIRGDIPGMRYPGGYTPVNWGGGGGTVDPVAPPAPSGLPDVEQIGYQGYSPDTQDFYRQQFQEMRMRDQGERERAMAAALRGEAAQNVPRETSDPWAWAGGASQFNPRTSTGAPNVIPTDYQLNPNYNLEAGMTNQQMLQNIMPTFSESEQVFLNKHPDYINEGDWSTRQGVLDWASSNPYTKDKGWTTVVNDIARILYTPSATTTGPSAPAGYAYPISGGT